MIDIHWRDSMRPARFFMMDARSAIGVALLLIHISLWTLGIAIALMVLFWGLEQRGLSYSAAIRAFRCWLCGHSRPAVVQGARSRFADFSDRSPID